MLHGTGRQCISRPSTTKLQVYGLGFRVSGFGFRVSGFGFRVSGVGFGDDVQEGVEKWRRCCPQGSEIQGRRCREANASRTHLYCSALNFPLLSTGVVIESNLIHSETPNPKPQTPSPKPQTSNPHPTRYTHPTSLPSILALRSYIDGVRTVFKGEPTRESLKVFVALHPQPYT